MPEKTYESDIDAESLTEAIAICKAEVQKHLEDDREFLSEYGMAWYHTDKKAIRAIISAPCNTNYTLADRVNKERGLGRTEVCFVSSNAKMRSQKLIPDEKSIDDPNWNKPVVTDEVLSVTSYPCKKGNGCEKVVRDYLDPDWRRDPALKGVSSWVVLNPSKCNLPASSLAPD